MKFFNLIALITVLEVDSFGLLPCAGKARTCSTLFASVIDNTDSLSIEDFLEDDPGNADLSPGLPLETEGHVDTDCEVLGDEEDIDVMTAVQLVVESDPGSLTPEEIDLLRAMLHDDKFLEITDADFMTNILDRLLSEFAVSGSENAIPHDDDFLAVKQAWFSRLESKDPKAKGLDTNALSLVVTNVWSLFEDQKALWKDTQLDIVRPSQATCSLVISCLSQSRERYIDKKVWSVYKDLEFFKVDPDAAIYTAVITSLAKSRAHGAAKRAEALLRKAVDEHPPTMRSGTPSGMGVEVCNTVLTAWAKSGASFGTERAEKLIVWMDETDANCGGNGLIKPNIYSFTSLIDAYAQENDWDGTAASDKILRNIVDLYVEGEIDLEPTIATWGIVFSAWARLARKVKRKAAPQADRLLNLLETLHEEGKVSFGPDHIVYSSVVRAYCVSTTDDAALRAAEILDDMKELYMDGDESMRPTAKLVSMVIDTWVRSSTVNGANAVNTAEYFWKQYQSDLESDDAPEERKHIREIYRALVMGFSRSGNSQRALEYIQAMIEQDFQPDTECYERAISANIQRSRQASDNPEATQAFIQHSIRIFQLMEAQGRENPGVAAVQPNERVYTVFLQALVQAQVPNLVVKVERLIQRMEDLANEGNTQIRPSTRSYNALLRACAKSRSLDSSEEGQKEAFATAMRTFQHIVKTRQDPDSVTFGNMLQCTLLLPDGAQKDKWIQATVKMCSDRGLMNDLVVRDLEEVASPETRSALGLSQAASS